MVLSNAERQARYRRNLRARANGVLPSDVAEAVEVMARYHLHIAADPDAPTWEEILKRSRRRDGLNSWHQWFESPFDPELCDEISAAGFDGELVRRVWPVAFAVLRPPQP
jgi:hypothetical protein